jgi:hypothetical protein
MVRTCVRECVQTWRLQRRAGPVTPKALETILSRATLLLMQRLEGHPPHLVVALLPGLLRSMLAVCLEMLAEEEERRGK